MNPNEGHRTELVRGLASAALLASLLLGVPLLLIVGVGWPLPQGIPSGSEVSTAIKTGGDPTNPDLEVDLPSWCGFSGYRCSPAWE